MREPLKLMLFITANFGLFGVGSVFGVGFGVVSFFGGSSVGSGELRGRVGSGVGTIGVTRGSGVGFLVTTFVESPRVRRYAIATPEMPTTKTIASIHGNGLRLLAPSATACRY
jgi:hypothetical protein